jgi:CRP/FNR family transcriptional regulator
MSNHPPQEATRIKSIKLFSHLNDADLEMILRRSNVINKGEGAEILFPGDADTPVYFILSGSVRVFRINPDGREQTLIQLGQGEVFNLPTVFLKEGKAPASAAALVDSSLLVIKGEDLRTLITTIPALNLAILSDLSAKLEHLTEVVHDISLRSVRSRLARFLHTHNSAPSPSFWTQDQIARQIGSTREAVNRAMRELIQDGIIRTERQRIIILDPALLEAEIEA